MLDDLGIESNGVPIYVQIRDHMLRAIGAGRLAPGEQLPTMRAVAVALRVDLNTVRHAYDELEQTGAIVVRRARGTFVADSPPPLDRAAEKRRLQSLALQVLAQVNAAGFSAEEMSQELGRIARAGKDRP